MRVSIATKFGRMVTYHDRLLPVKSREPLITWSCEILWQTKTITYLIPQWLWPPNLAGWWLTLTLWSHGLARLWDQLKPLYLHKHCLLPPNVFQVDNLSWGSPTRKVTWSFKHMVLWPWGAYTQNASHNAVDMCSHEVTWQAENICHNVCGHKTDHSDDIPRGVLTHKFEWPLNKLVLWGHVTS